MFRILCDPSSGSTELRLTEITRGDSQIFLVCLVGVWQRMRTEIRSRERQTYSGSLYRLRHPGPRLLK